LAIMSDSASAADVAHATVPRELREGALAHAAPWPAIGGYAEGFRGVAVAFAGQIARGEEIGAGLTVYHRGVLVADLAGGFADVEAARPWRHDTRLVVFSVTKGFAAMALHRLAERGLLDWEAPASTYWPAFARNGKEGLTLRTLFGHRGGLAALDAKLTLDDCVERWGLVARALEAQRPASPAVQGYHAITYGMFARELFERIAGERMGAFLRRELFAPLGSDVFLGAPAALDDRVATLYAPSAPTRLAKMLTAVVRHPDSNEARVARDVLSRRSLARRAFANPSVGLRGVLAYNDVPVRRAELPWGSATASARGVARAYLPYSIGGVVDGRRYVEAATLATLRARDGWSERDAVLQKPIGWNRGFMKEQHGLFGPNEDAFGHAGMGGALGWCDPRAELAIGYVMNRMDWRVRSPRALAICRAIYESPPVRAAG
jgi:CubicO group peptidase (beta-lactamase class C family)